MNFELEPQSDPAPIDIFDRNCILILDENRESLEQMAWSFGQQNFTVLCHTSGQLGLQAARKSHPDCILVNTHLIDFDGIDLCRQLVDDSQTCGIPVIVMGRSADQTTVKHARSAGCQFFVAKPIDLKVMVFLINEAIAESRSWIVE